MTTQTVVHLGVQLVLSTLEVVQVVNVAFCVRVREFIGTTLVAFVYARSATSLSRLALGATRSTNLFARLGVFVSLHGTIAYTLIARHRIKVAAFFALCMQLDAVVIAIVALIVTFAANSFAFEWMRFQVFGHYFNEMVVATCVHFFGYAFDDGVGGVIADQGVGAFCATARANGLLGTGAFVTVLVAG